MIIELASTTAHKIAKRMVDLRESHGAIALGRVLTLVLVVDEASAEPAIESANHASHEHPAGSSSSLRRRHAGPPGWTPRSESVVMPGRAKSSCYGHSGPSPGIRSPWCSHCCCRMRRSSPGGPPLPPPFPPTIPVGQLATRRITDAAAAKRPGAALVARAESYQPGDTDLAWSRVTGWRALLARWTNHCSIESPRLG